jgi:glutamate-1-semialdehyde 2,1-aminomutase
MMDIYKGLLEEYHRQNTRSLEAYLGARRHLPSGCTRNVLHYSPFPLYMFWGNGSKIWDIDGNERIDLNFNNTTLILGHNHPAVLEAIKRQLERGTVLGAPTECEIELAEELLRRLPGADKIRFTPSGTEAIMQAVRLARSYTGREKIAKCEGAYHGSWDAVAVSVTPSLTEAGPKASPRKLPQHEGIPKAVVKNTLVFPFNDAEAVESLIRKHRQELAAVIVEPMQRDIPTEPEFLKTLRETTQDLDIPLIFDEVITFRVSPGGAQRLYDVEPDITTLGKIIGGGMPIGAYAFTEQMAAPMKIPESPFPETRPPRLGFSGTFNAHPLSMAAGLAVMRELRPAVYERLNQLGRRTREGIKAILDQFGVAAQVLGMASLFRVLWTKEEVSDYRSVATSDRGLSHCFSIALINRGVYLRAHPNISTATTEEDVKAVLEAMSDALEVLVPIIELRAPHLLERG